VGVAEPCDDVGAGRGSDAERLPPVDFLVDFLEELRSCMGGTGLLLRLPWDLGDGDSM
jgi:hypothetical protein